MRMTAHGRYAFGALAVLGLAVLAAPTAWAQAGNTDTAASDVDAFVVAAITLGNTEKLNFGTFTAPGNGEGIGTVTIPPVGSRTSSANVGLANTVTPTAAGYDVGGESGKVYDITLPNNGDITLTGVGDPMAVNDFTDNLGGVGTVGTNVSFTVGATLTVAEEQAPGEYDGSFDVIVTYQ